MPIRDFFLPDAKKRVAKSIEAIESETAAEIVVAVRRRSAHYRHVDIAVGSALAFASLVAVIFLPQPFATEMIPVDVAVAFVIGLVVSANLPPLRRLLLSRRAATESVRTAARAAFYEMGIARTTGRTGVLVFVSMLERRVELVTDDAVKPAELDARWREAVAAIEAAVRRADLPGFLGALGTVAAPLAVALPVRDDDVDELPNEPVIS